MATPEAQYLSIECTQPKCIRVCIFWQLKITSAIFKNILAGRKHSTEHRNGRWEERNSYTSLRSTKFQTRFFSKFESFIVIYETPFLIEK